MIHCSDCEFYNDTNEHDPITQSDNDWKKYISNLKCTIGERIFVDIACKKFKERM